jgi:hypothetical protein
MASRKLKRLAREYLAARAAQELDHTNPALNSQRTEAHNTLMFQMDAEDIPYTSREEAATIARGIVAGTYRRPAKRQTRQSKAERDGQLPLPM